MKRYMALKYFITALENNDVIVAAGKDLCSEAYAYDDERFLYLTDNFGHSLAVALGIAMSTNKRVYFLCEDYYLLNNLLSAAQVGVSKCTNMFIVTFISNSYQFADNMPSVFGSIPKPKAVLFDFGFTTHDYSKTYDNAIGAKTTKKKLFAAKGPLSVFIKISEGAKDLPDIGIDLASNLERVSAFIQNKELGTSLFNTTPKDIFLGGF